MYKYSIVFCEHLHHCPTICWLVQTLAAWLHPVGGHHDPKKRRQKQKLIKLKIQNLLIKHFFILFQSDVVACISFYVMNFLENENLQEETWTLNHSKLNHLGIELKENFKIFLLACSIFITSSKNVLCATGSRFLAKFYFHKWKLWGKEYFRMSIAKCIWNDISISSIRSCVTALDL